MNRTLTGLAVLAALWWLAPLLPLIFAASAGVVFIVLMARIFVPP